MDIASWPRIHEYRSLYTSSGCNDGLHNTNYPDVHSVGEVKHEGTANNATTMHKSTLDKI